MPKIPTYKHVTTKYLEPEWSAVYTHDCPFCGLGITYPDKIDSLRENGSGHVIEVHHECWEIQRTAQGG